MSRSHLSQPFDEALGGPCALTLRRRPAVTLSSVRTSLTSLNLLSSPRGGRSVARPRRERRDGQGRCRSSGESARSARSLL
jgi:hypothetical protein